MNFTFLLMNFIRWARALLSSQFWQYPHKRVWELNAVSQDLNRSVFILWRDDSYVLCAVFSLEVFLEGIFLRLSCFVCLECLSILILQKRSLCSSILRFIHWGLSLFLHWYWPFLLRLSESINWHRSSYKWRLHTGCHAIKIIWENYVRVHSSPSKINFHVY